MKFRTEWGFTLKIIWLIHFWCLPVNQHMPWQNRVIRCSIWGTHNSNYTLLATYLLLIFLFRLFLYTTDGCDIFIRAVDLVSKYTALHSTNRTVPIIQLYQHGYCLLRCNNNTVKWKLIDVSKDHAASNSGPKRKAVRWPGRRRLLLSRC
jgi:hypothetical protein